MRTGWLGKSLCFFPKNQFNRRYTFVLKNTSLMRVLRCHALPTTISPHMGYFFHQNPILFMKFLSQNRVSFMAVLFFGLSFLTAVQSSYAQVVADDVSTYRRSRRSVFPDRAMFIYWHRLDVQQVKVKIYRSALNQNFQQAQPVGQPIIKTFAQTIREKSVEVPLSHLPCGYAYYLEVEETLFSDPTNRVSQVEKRIEFFRCEADANPANNGGGQQRRN
jgi:hypothetical protein